MTFGKLQIKQTNQLPLDLIEAEGLILGRIVFGNVAIAFCAIGRMKTTNDTGFTQIEISTLSARQVDLIGSDTSSFEQFNRHMQEETGLRMVLKLGDHISVHGDSTSLTPPNS
jgi:hypothetical protein